jgi:hypothetical protein
VVQNGRFACFHLVFHTTSKHFSRSVACCLTTLVLTRHVVQNDCFACFSYHLEALSRSAASRYAYSLLPHVPHIDDVTPCVGLLPYHFGVDQELAMCSKMTVLCVFHTTSKHFSRSAASRYAYSLPPHVPHIDDVKSCADLSFYCFGVNQELWSKMLFLYVRVFHTTSQHFSRSAESMYVYLLPVHVAHAHDVISCICPSSIYVGVLQVPDMWSKMAVLHVLFDLSKHVSRSAQSRCVFLLPSLEEHSQHLMSCISLARPGVGV